MSVPKDIAFLTVIAWPKGWDEQAKLGALAEAAGIAPTDGRRILLREPPLVAARLSIGAAKDAAGALRALHVPAIEIADEAIKSVGEPLRAKRLEAAVGAPEPMYLVERWRGEPVGMKMSEVVLIVRGHIRAFEQRTTFDPSATLGFGATGLGHGLAGGATGIIGSLADIAMEARSNSSNNLYGGTTLGPRTTSVRNEHSRDVLDLHLRNGPRIRIDPLKFNFDVLGAQKGLVDSQNMGTLALRLAEEARNAQVDLSFDGFRAPGLSKTHNAPDGTTKRDDLPLFDFYSVWRLLVHRAITGAAPRRAQS